MEEKKRKNKKQIEQETQLTKKIYVSKIVYVKMHHMMHIETSQRVTCVWLDEKKNKKNGLVLFSGGKIYGQIAI